MLERLYTTVVTMDMNCLAIQAEPVNQLESGVEYSQLALVSTV